MKTDWGDSRSGTTVLPCENKCRASRVPWVLGHVGPQRKGHHGHWGMPLGPTVSQVRRKWAEMTHGLAVTSSGVGDGKTPMVICFSGESRGPPQNQLVLSCLPCARSWTEDRVYLLSNLQNNPGRHRWRNQGPGESHFAISYHVNNNSNLSLTGKSPHKFHQHPSVNNTQSKQNEDLPAMQIQL